MAGFNTIPASGGGGGQANMTFVASVHMVTYNRTWAQGGTPGYYGMFSANQENGYVYFVGATTTGGPLNRLINVTHDFTSINIIAPQNDMCSLYKAKVKATTEFANPFGSFASFGSPITSSGNFVLPNNALPLVNALVVGGGGGGGRHGGGGGAGGNVVKLTAFQAVGTTGVTIGGAGAYNASSSGGDTYFGNVYAMGGGFGGSHNQTGGSKGNGGGGGGHGTAGNGGSGTTQTSSTGLGNSGAPAFFGGFNGARASGGEPGGGGAGAGGAAAANISTYSRQGANGHSSDISGSTQHYSVGGGGGQHSSSPGNHGGSNWTRGYYGMGGHGGSGDQGGYDPGSNNSQGTEGGQGIVIVRYYIP